MKTTETEKAILFEETLLLSKHPISLPSKIERKLISLFKTHQNLLFVGTGSSLHVAEWASWLFSSARPVNTIQTMPSWDLLEKINGARNKPRHHLMPSRKTLLILFSHRGYRGLTKKVLDSIQKKKIGSSLLVCSQGSPTGPSLGLYTVDPEPSQAHTKSVLAAMLMAACLRDLAETRRDSTTTPFLKNDNERIFFRKLFKTRHKLLKNLHRPVTVIGAREYLPIAKEIALKLREMCYLPACTFAQEEFLHGPFVALAPGDPVLFLGLSRHQDSTRCLKVLKSLHASVLTPPPSILRLQRDLRSIALLIWGQRLCLSWSQILDTNPDDNRTHIPRYARAKMAAEKL